MGNPSRLNYSFNGTSLITDVFIETGTYTGRSVLDACKQDFKEIHSIEWLEKHYLACKKKVKGYENCHLHHGSSPDVLPQIIDGTKTTTFWLDAHYQGVRDDEQDPKYGECPLLEELKVIFSIDWEVDPFVIIDDVHCFTDGLPRTFNKSQWPLIEEIKSLFPDNYTFETADLMLVCMP